MANQRHFQKLPLKNSQLFKKPSRKNSAKNVEDKKKFEVD